MAGKLTEALLAIFLLLSIRRKMMAKVVESMI